MSYYVYQHVRLDTDKPFYIGMGTKQKKGSVYKRAYKTGSRNRYWIEVVKESDYRVEILKEFNSREEALIEETKLIREYGYQWDGTGILCNIISCSKDKSPLFTEKMREISTPVHQYDLEGNFLKTFPSVNDALKEFPGDIYNAWSKNKRNFTAGGFQWRKRKSNKIKPYKPELIGKPIYQYSISGGFIKKWKGSRLPSEELGVNRSSIRNCLIGISESAGGYVWSFEKDLKLKFNYSVYENGRLIYSSLRLVDCAEYLHLNQHCVSAAMRAGRTYEGYIFKKHKTKTNNARNNK